METEIAVNVCDVVRILIFALFICFRFNCLLSNVYDYNCVIKVV